MKLFETLYNKVLTWSRHRHAVKYLSLVSFAEAIFFPIPVAAMLLPMCFAEPQKSYRYAFITLTFSVLGGILGYALGYFAFEMVEPIFSGHAETLTKAKDWFGQYGVWIVLMAGFSPIPYKVFTITAGLLSMAFLPFILASIVGRASQFYLIAFLVNKFGPAMEPKVRQYIEWLGWAFVMLVVAAIAYLNLH